MSYKLSMLSGFGKLSGSSELGRLGILIISD